ncbi:ABC transporter ATP-binding protein, partial [Francisella tularensis subsp. holarctica]|nr:ABC transporter ATP-binding protein [Francisella tularensis subsp. holarctica]
MSESLIQVRDLSTKLVKEWIHKDLNLDIPFEKIICI